VGLSDDVAAMAGRQNLAAVLAGLNVARLGLGGSGNGADGEEGQNGKGGELHIESLGGFWKTESLGVWSCF
jgi:hypothetical protein